MPRTGNRVGRRAAGVVAAVLVPLLAVSGCGGDGKPAGTPKPTAPTGHVDVPPGTKLTRPGTTLHFGQKAVVAFEPNVQRNTVLELTVDRARRGSIADLSMYTLDATTKKSVPYYVTVTVRNVGRGDVGKTLIPLLGMYDDELLQPSGFTNLYRPCPSRPLPASFAPSDRLTTCLMYLVPDGGGLKGISFRPSSGTEAIEWHGDIATPKPSPKPSPKPAPKPKAKKKAS